MTTDRASGVDPTGEAAGDGELVCLEHRHLRRALEFAVQMGGELGKRRRSVPVPKAVRAQVGSARIPTGALGGIRRAVEQDDEFRRLLAAGALPELVDPVGLLWLQRPPGWQAAIREELAALAASEQEADLVVSLKREEKRRIGAEQAAVRTRSDLLMRDELIRDLRDQLQAMRTDLTKAAEEIDELRAELIDVRTESRHARDRERAAIDRLAAERDARQPVDARPGPSIEPVTEVPAVPVVDLGELNEIVQALRAAAERAEALVTTDDASEPVQRPHRRRQLRLPGGVIGTSGEAAEFLLRSDAAVLVDGYNVAKLAWPSRPLEAQRSRLLDALENAARRFGSDITVVFDGTTVVGAHSTRRRLLRVVYSPEGVIADDVIRDEVRRLPPSRPVVVVTNDAEIVNDVKALGANVVPSNALLAVL